MWERFFLAQKFKWDLYKLFSKKLSEKQMVSVLILLLAVFLFVKGCTVRFSHLKNNVCGFSGERFWISANTRLLEL